MTHPSGSPQTWTARVDRSVHVRSPADLPHGVCSHHELDELVHLRHGRPVRQHRPATGSPRLVRGVEQPSQFRSRRSHPDPARQLAPGIGERHGDEELECRVSGRNVELYYTEFGGSSINFVLCFWVQFGRSQADFLAARSEAVMALKRAFDAHDISIPFPIRTLDFGILGGVGLSEELREARAGAGGTS